MTISYHYDVNYATFQFNLFDMNLSQWRIWESYQLKDGYRGQAPTDADGNVLPFIGYDKNLRYVEDGQEYPLVEGKLQLQSEAGEVFYRRAQIKEITELPQHYAHYFE